MLLVLVAIWLLFSPVLALLIGRRLRKQAQFLFDSPLHLDG
jgi:hypothetical protein